MSLTIESPKYRDITWDIPGLQRAADYALSKGCLLTLVGEDVVRLKERMGDPWSWWENKAVTHLTLWVVVSYTGMKARETFLRGVSTTILELLEPASDSTPKPSDITSPDTPTHHITLKMSDMVAVDYKRVLVDNMPGFNLNIDQVKSMSPFNLSHGEITTHYIDDMRSLDIKSTNKFTVTLRRKTGGLGLTSSIDSILVSIGGPAEKIVTFKMPSSFWQEFVHMMGLEGFVNMIRSKHVFIEVEHYMDHLLQELVGMIGADDYIIMLADQHVIFKQQWSAMGDHTHPLLQVHPSYWNR